MMSSTKHRGTIHRIAVACFALLLLKASTVNALPSGFTSEQIIQGMGFITEITFSPDDTYMYVARKFGQIYLMKQNGDYEYGDRQMALDLEEETCSNGERGLGSIALHPGFSANANRWLYVYHTVPGDDGDCGESAETGARNLLVRYRVASDMTLDPSSREVLMKSAPHPKAVHNGGRIMFGKDGYLYLPTGDGGERTYSLQTNNLFGGILRFTPNGDIPPTNPFVGDADAVRCHQGGVAPQSSQKCLELYAIGLRNPFKMDMDPNAAGVRFMVNDVGASFWEEMSLGGEGVPAGPKGLQDFGWPSYEGPCLRGRDAASDCGPPNEYVEPYHFYRHKSGGAAVGAAWIPNGFWPSEYDGGYLYSEFVFGEITLVHDSGRGACYDCTPLSDSRKEVSVFESVSSVITMRFGPYRDCKVALYYSTSCCGGQLHRIIYEGNDVPDIPCEKEGTAVTQDTEGTQMPTTPDPTAAPTAFELAETGGYPGPEFVWSTENCPLGIDYCGILEFCQDGDTYGYRLPCETDSCECRGMFGPLIRVRPGNKYRFILRNASPDPRTMTNIHPHGLHIVGDGDGDDVMRKVTGGTDGKCLDYTWDLKADHPGGTYWYHSHHHGMTQVQVEGGAFGMFIVDDNLSVNPDTPAWASNERLLQVYHSDPNFFALGNGRANEVIDIDANQWYRLRVSMVDTDAVPHDLVFHDEDGLVGCTIHKVASDGIWRSTIPGPSGMQWEMTGASRGDFAIRCTETNQLIPITFNGLRVATIRVSDVVATNPYVMEEWKPVRPYALRDLRDEELPEGNTFEVRLGYDYVNDEKWDPMTPLLTVAFDQVHEWTIRQTSHHPFHLHLYHMQVVQPGGCGAHEEGEWYDTISAPDDCLIRFSTSDFGQRCVLHCHVFFHEDAGSMAWINVTGPGMPLNEVQAFEYECPAFLQAPSAPAPAPAPAPQAPVLENPVTIAAPFTPSPTSTPCRPGFLGLRSGDPTSIVRGSPFVNEEFGVFVQQNSDGNFVVYRGSPGAADDTIWATKSGTRDIRQDFHAMLEDDGRLSIYEDVPGSPGSLHWSNGVSSQSRNVGEFFLGIDCSRSFVSVYEGSPLNPGRAIWNSAPTNEPTSFPTHAETASPTSLPNTPSTPVPSAQPVATSLVVEETSTLVPIKDPFENSVTDSNAISADETDPSVTVESTSNANTGERSSGAFSARLQSHGLRITLIAMLGAVLQQFL